LRVGPKAFRCDRSSWGCVQRRSLPEHDLDAQPDCADKSGNDHGDSRLEGKSARISVRVLGISLFWDIIFRRRVFARGLASKKPAAVSGAGFEILAMMSLCQ
jgi:hypothetical protein